MGPLSRSGRGRTKTLSVRYGAIAVVLGLTVFTGGHGTAWAEPDGTDTRDTSVSQSESAAGTDASPEPKVSPTASTGGHRAGTSSPSGAGKASGSTAVKKTADKESLDKDTVGSPPAKTVGDENAPTTGTEGIDTDSTDDAADPESPEPEPAAPPTDSPSEPSEPLAPPESTDAKKSTEAHPATAGRIATLRAPVSSPTKDDDEVSVIAGPDTDIAPASARVATFTADPAASAAAVATLSTAAVEITTPTPRPVSPIAQIAALPGRIVNALLQLVGITTSATTGTSPLSPAPLADLFFAVFRRLEEAAGLHSPVNQPVPPALVYEGPLDTPTPTVKQFLDAATTEYVLGGTPGGMVPFTVDGWPMRSLYLDTGSDASVWVTPQNQIIIAYSGTTGGTNLLFNPLIAITQIVTDIEAGLGNTTPRAFTQSVDFAEKVKAEAVAQGYSEDDIFVTGHSLGAWQAQYVAQQIGLNGIGFEGPGLNSVVPGNGADSLFVNTATYGDMAGFLASDLPGLYPLAPAYVPGGGVKPHYGPIVLLGDPQANTPMVNAAGLFGKGIIGTLVSAIDLFGNFFAKHLPGVQAYHLDVLQDPGVVPWLGINEGPVYTGFGDMTIPQFLEAASDKGILVTP